MKKKVRKYEVGGLNLSGITPVNGTPSVPFQDANGLITGANPNVVTIADTQYLGYDNYGRKVQDTGFKQNLGLGSNILRGLNFGVGAVSDFINDARNTKQERARYLSTLQRLQDPNFVQNDIPIYTKYGGDITAEKAKMILKDGTIKGNPITDKQRKFFGAIANGAVPKAEYGMDNTYGPKPVPKYTGLPNTPMYEMNLFANPYDPNSEQKHLDSLRYATNFQNIINNPASFNYDNAKQAAISIGQQPINGVKTEDQRRKEYAEAMQYLFAGQDALNQLKKGKKAKYGIEINPAHKGEFTAKANEHDMTPLEFASHVLSNKDNYDTETIKQAVFAHNFAKKYGGGTPYKVGGDIPVTQGLPNRSKAVIEAEGGEIYQQPDGNIIKISDSAPDHENGGVPINNVQRVLEDTSTSRKDKISKSLVVTPEHMQEMFGIEVKKPLSHSEAMEVATEELNRNTRKISTKLKKILDSVDDMPSNKYSQNSLELSTKELSKYPSKQDIFDTLFQHQESLKQNQDMSQAKYGVSLPKAQDGLEVLYNKARSPKATKSDIRAFQMAFHEDPRTQGYADDLIKNRPAITNYGKQKGYSKLDVRQNEDGLLGDTTKQYFKYFENKVAPSAPTTDNGYEIGQGTSADYDTTLPAPEGHSSATVYGTPRKTQGTPPQLDSFRRTQYSTFNQPLNWTDILAPAAAYLSADRIPANYNPAEFKKISPRLENVLPYLEQGQRDFNTITNMQDSNSGAGSANNVNAFAQKYGIDNQIRAGVNDRNLQREYQADVYNAGVSDRQSLADQQARALFEHQQLAGMEAQRQQKLTSLDELMTRINLNRKQNREGNLLMKLFPNFDSYGNYNGNQRYLVSQAPSTSSNNNSAASLMDKRMQQLSLVFPSLTHQDKLRILQEYGRNDRKDLQMNK